VIVAANEEALKIADQRFGPTHTRDSSRWGVLLLSLGGRAPQEIRVKGWNHLDALVWMADGKGLFVSSRMQRGSVLLQVDLQGNSHILWKREGGMGTFGIPSPDGRHLAMMGWTLNSNIWMMENFYR